MLLETVRKLDMNGVVIPERKRLHASIGSDAIRKFEYMPVLFIEKNNPELHNPENIEIPAPELQIVELETQTEKDFVEEFVDFMLTGGIIIPRVFLGEDHSYFQYALLSHAYRAEENYSPLLIKEMPSNKSFLRCVLKRELFDEACKRNKPVFTLEYNQCEEKFFLFKRSKDFEKFLDDFHRPESAFNYVKCVIM